MEITSIVQGFSIIIMSLLTGSMVFFSFAMAPLIFIKLDIAVAGRFVRAVFPWYYLLIIVLGATACLLLLAFAPINSGLMAVVACSGLYCRQYLMPKINEYRDRSLAGEAEVGKTFDRLHKRSEILNGLQLLAVFAVLVHIAFVDFS
jgi:hypothetical protein